jgi:hypothetical protein
VSGVALLLLALAACGSQARGVGASSGGSSSGTPGATGLGANGSGSTTGSAGAGATTGGSGVGSGSLGSTGSNAAAGGSAGSGSGSGTSSGAGSGGLGSSGSDGGSTASSGAVVPVVPTFVNYELTGSWPALIARSAAGPIQQQPGALTYKTIEVQDQFLAESCSIADYNNDGIVDISSGRRWYEGPDFMKAHVFRPGQDALPRAGNDSEVQTGLSDDWADYPFDVDGDGWTDIINLANPDADAFVNSALMMPQKHATAYWYKNPGAPSNQSDTAWTATLMASGISMEEHGLVDVDGDGKPEVLGGCMNVSGSNTDSCAAGVALGSGVKGYYQADWSNPTGAWTFHAVTRSYALPFGGETGFLNGVGLGDINGDGRPDFLEMAGVWLQPATSPAPSAAWGGAGPQYAGSWVPNPFSIPADLQTGVGPMGGSQMFAYDVDGDGLTDVISADDAYGWGLAWYQQMPPGAASCLGATTTATAASPSCFVKHAILSDYGMLMSGVEFSQLHGVQLVDMDGDGLRDIVTGKSWLEDRYNDADSFGTPVVYVFKLVRDASPPRAGQAHFEPHRVNAAVAATGLVDAGPFAAPWTGGSGVGRQIAVGQINAQTDGIMDICVASKLGLFVYLGQ